MLLKRLAKDPSNYESREVEKHEPAPTEVTLADDQLTRPTMVDETVAKQRVEKRKMFEKKLSENTAKMNKIKKVIDCKL